MPLFALIQYDGDTVVSANYDLTDVGYFVRKTVKEFIDFTAPEEGAGLIATRVSDGGGQIAVCRSSCNPYKRAKS